MTDKVWGVECGMPTRGATLLPPSSVKVSNLLPQTRERMLELGWGNSEQLYTESQVKEIVAEFAVAAVSRRREDFRRDEEAHAAGLCKTLSARELDVVKLLGKGLSYRQAAEALGISWHTVNYYTKGINRKLDVCSTVEAAVVATRAGLI